MKSLTPLLLCAFASIAFAVNPIIVQEQEFVDSKTNERFVIIGVDYQPGGQGAYGTGSGDPLSNATRCLRDAALMQNMGINTIRSYNVDPTLNHDECASIFNSVGIYMLIDVNSPLGGQSLDRTNPSGTYTTDYLTHIFTVVEAFKSYPNTLGFFGGNEIINDIGTAKNNPPYMRAVQRDLKSYIAAHANRVIPVGYSAAQVQDVLQDTWAYLQCNNSDSGQDMSRSDFFGLNSYSWCGSQSSYTISGYDQLVQTFGNTTIPVFFSEYGCNDPAPRVFDEVPVLYGPQMTVLSGGLVYEWTQETSNYGLVQDNSNGSATLLPDFDTLLAQYQKLNVTLITTQNETATNLQPPRCSSGLISSSGFSTDFDVPQPPSGAEALISRGVSNAPTGTIVAIKQTQVQVPVYATNGGELQGLAIKPADGANHPGDGSGLSTAGVSGTRTGGSSSSKGLAARPTGAVMGGSAVAAAVFGAAVFAL
ncbi:glycoside hydrolase family 72 protein [Dothistroma septosporum NZE10]|uniref:1,3-beta-glucanosyltransferase n=1 Tax=Dothistroma septosporum (strain NZE10 / CBS 128990) TaxID=675120 RepID=N1PEH0_DOTSN|nr:glycoside hydrolase family 72 protein [Dothistroma septosporum NZE10]